MVDKWLNEERYRMNKLEVGTEIRGCNQDPSLSSAEVWLGFGGGGGDRCERAYCTVTVSIESVITGKKFNATGKGLYIPYIPSYSGTPDCSRYDHWHYGDINSDGSFKKPHYDVFDKPAKVAYDGATKQWKAHVKKFKNDWWEAGGGNSKELKQAMDLARTFNFEGKCCSGLPTLEDLRVADCRKNPEEGKGCFEHCMLDSDCGGGKVCQREESCGPTEYAKHSDGQCKNWREGKRHWGNRDTVEVCASRCSRQEVCYGFVHEVLLGGKGSCITMWEPCIPGGGSWTYFKCNVSPLMGKCVPKTKPPTRGPTKSPTTTRPTPCPKRETCRETPCQKGGCNGNEWEKRSSMCWTGGRKEICCKMVCK